MIQDIKELFGQASGPGDMATILIAGTAGYVVDAGLNLVGFLEPGFVGLFAATSALGLKKSWDARRANGNSDVKEVVPSAMGRGEGLLDILEREKGKGDRYLELYHRLSEDVTYRRRRIITDESLGRTVDEVVDELRSLSEASRRTKVVEPIQASHPIASASMRPGATPA